MNSISFSSSFHPVTSPAHTLIPNTRLQPFNCCISPYSLKIRKCPSLSLQLPVARHNFRTCTSATTPSNEGTVSVVSFEDVMEKDWSFLDANNGHSDEEHEEKIKKIITAGGISENSKVLISISSEEFVDRVVDSSPCKQILVVHDSLFVLACIKEAYDTVKCWQGELIYVPEKWAPFDVVFLYFLPAMPFELSQVLEALGKRCMPGARIVISHPQGRKVLEEQRKQYPDVVVSNLPDMTTLQNVAVENSFEIMSFVDEMGLYLAVLKFKG